MRLNLTKLKIIELISQKIEVSNRDVSRDLHISKSLTSKYLTELAERGLLEKRIKKYVISPNIFARILSNMIMEDSSLIEIFSNEGIPILMVLVNREKLGIEELSKKLDLSTSTIYPYLRKFLKRQIIYKKEGSLVFNWELWAKLQDFISFYRNHYVLSQFKKVPNNAKIYFESPYEIVFSLTTEIDFASKTAFSEYEKYGIRLMEKEIFYRLDQYTRARAKSLDVRTVFLDSLRIAGAENEESTRRRLYCYLFYRKNINHLKKIKHPDLDILREIAEGEKLDKKFPNFPSREEIIERCRGYDIKI